MPSSIWKKTADGMPPPDAKKRVVGIWMGLDGLPVIAIYTCRRGEWRKWNEDWRTLVETVRWAYEDELALEVLGEH